MALNLVVGVVLDLRLAACVFQYKNKLLSILDLKYSQ
jgi:ABC-type sulfate transport system permease subunit